jgi:hypothetical protein
MFLISARGQIHYTASDFLPGVLKNAELGSSYEPTKTAFQQAVGTRLALFDWMHQMVPVSDTDWRPVSARRHPGDDGAHGSSKITGRASILSDEMVPRPEKALFNLAMAGLGRGTEQYYMHDFPWKYLGRGTVVDVGGGIGRSHIEFRSMRALCINNTRVGSFCMQLHSIYPELSLVVQDTGFMIHQAHSAWEMKYPSAVLEGKVKIVAHDFFEKNPVLGAEVYWLRHIMYELEPALQTSSLERPIANAAYSDMTGPTTKPRPSYPVSPNR